MNTTLLTTRKLAYGRKLVNAGVSGVRTGYRKFDPQQTSALIASSVDKSLKLAALGVCLGMLPALILRRNARGKNAVVFGALGGALGFCAGFSWRTRKLTSSLAHSAIHEVHLAQDQHWLETNPIDYA
jgi:hypothetical protein